MSLVIRDLNTVPAEDWSYFIVATNMTISTKNYALLYPKIVQHCQSNNVSIPSEQSVIDSICKSAHVPCYDSDTRQPLINAWSLNLPVPARPGCCGKASIPTP